MQFIQDIGMVNGVAGQSKESSTVINTTIVENPEEILKLIENFSAQLGANSLSTNEK